MLDAAMRLVGRKIGRRLITLNRPDIDNEAASIIRRVMPFTMTSPERVYCTIRSVRYIAAAGFPGEVVECGVWRGGNMMAAALTLASLGKSIPIRMFDTFTGMPRPGAEDVRCDGSAALATYEAMPEG